jgi:hypothetical protein
MLAAGIAWVFTLPFLQLLGRHSLQVYAWHVLIIYGVNYLDSQVQDMSQLAKTAIAALGIMLLALPPVYREARARLAEGSFRKPSEAQIAGPARKSRKTGPDHAIEALATPIR